MESSFLKKQSSFQKAIFFSEKAIFFSKSNLLFWKSNLLLKKLSSFLKKQSSFKKKIHQERAVNFHEKFSQASSRTPPNEQCIGTTHTKLLRYSMGIVPQWLLKDAATGGTSTSTRYSNGIGLDHAGFDLYRRRWGESDDDLWVCGSFVSLASRPSHAFSLTIRILEYYYSSTVVYPGRCIDTLFTLVPGPYCQEQNCTILSTK